MNLFLVSDALKTVNEPIVEIAELLGCTCEIYESTVNPQKKISFIKWRNTANTVDL